MTVGPEILDSDNPLFNVNGKNKAVKCTSDTLGDLIIDGGASGVVAAVAGSRIYEKLGYFHSGESNRF